MGGGGILALTRSTGGGGLGLGAKETQAVGGGDLALMRQTWGGGVGANEAHRGGGGTHKAVHAQRGP